MKSNIRYVVAGGLAIDHVISFEGRKCASSFGGNAAYGSAGIRIWDYADSIGIMARYGEDFPKEWIREIAECKFNTNGIRQIEGRHLLSGGWIYDEAGNRDETIHSDLFDGLKEDFPSNDPLLADRAQLWFKPDSEDIPEEYEQAEAVLVAPAYYEKQFSVVRKFRDLGAKYIIVDPGIWYMNRDSEEKIRDLLNYADAFLPSQVEVAGLWGDISPDNAARKLGNMGARIAVVKTGKDGCVVYETAKNKLWHVPCYLTEAKDPTGAGDSFCGGFLAGLLRTGDALEAALYGTVAASFIVEGFGAGYTYGVKPEEARKRQEILRKTGGF